jgi:hypothetical protein
VFLLLATRRPRSGRRRPYVIPFQSAASQRTVQVERAGELVEARRDERRVRRVQHLSASPGGSGNYPGRAVAMSRRAAAQPVAGPLGTPTVCHFAERELNVLR